VRVVFMGTPVFAVEILRALIAADHQVCAVYTQPPRPAGRGQSPLPSPVHSWAASRGLDVAHPTSLKSAEEQQLFAALKADVGVVAAYGLLLPQPILDAPRYGCLNVHASLLPRWRGAAPIQRAILAGDVETGVCLMQMEAGLDTGPVLLRSAVPITPTDTSASLHTTLAALGASLTTQGLAQLTTLPPTPQPSTGVEYAHKITKAEAQLNWQQPAALLERQIRAFNPAPGAWFMAGGERIKVHGAQLHPQVAAAAPGTVLDAHGLIACAEGALRLESVQRPGRTPQPFTQAMQGLAALQPGNQLAPVSYP
jgi:methionyl-tRNA formyltransferase